MSLLDKQRFDKETEQMKKQGFFINKDGVKSTSILPEIKNFPADTVLPRKARASFMFFNKMNYQKYSAANPGMKITEVMRKIAEAWNSMTSTQKKPFEDLAAQDKVRHDNEIKQLKTKGFFINSEGVKSTDLKKKITKVHRTEMTEEKKTKEAVAAKSIEKEAKA